MPDICMCQNEKCGKKKTCYRYMAIPDRYWQSYFYPDENNCEHYWKISRKTSNELKERKEKFFQELKDSGEFEGDIENV